MPSGFTQLGPGAGAPSHSQHEWAWWSGEKFHTLQRSSSQQAAEVVDDYY